MLRVRLAAIAFMTLSAVLTTGALTASPAYAGLVCQDAGGIVGIGIDGGGRAFALCGDHSIVYL